jgi:D-3-phosphoglycerate dehydrogenase
MYDGWTLAEMEGRVFARAGGIKVAIYASGGRGVPLAARPSVQEAFRRGSLEVSWAENLTELDKDTDILVSTGAPVGQDVIAKCPKISMVVGALTGIDHIDLELCRARGITVTNIPEYASNSGAQLALSLVLEHLNCPSDCHAAIQAGGWRAPLQEGLQLKTVGIVGTGSLGVRCAELFKAFRVKSIIGFDVKSNPAFLECGTYTQSLAAMFLDADIVVLCLPLTPETTGIISSRILELLRPESLLVNIGRGAVVDEIEMAALLQKRRFRAALDVFSTEPLPDDHPLRSVPSDVLTMTPHVGYQTAESLGRRFEATVRNILAFIAGHAVNVVL